MRTVSDHPGQECADRRFEPVQEVCRQVVVGTLDQAYVPPAIRKTELRRRPRSERCAA